MKKSQYTKQKRIQQRNLEFLYESEGIRFYK